AHPHGLAVTAGLVGARLPCGGPGVTAAYPIRIKLRVRRGVEMGKSFSDRTFAVEQVVLSQSAAVPLLARFTAVWLEDSTTVVLPDALEGLWRGCGGRTAAGTRYAVTSQ